MELGLNFSGLKPFQLRYWPVTLKTPLKRFRGLFLVDFCYRNSLQWLQMDRDHRPSTQEKLHAPPPLVLILDHDFQSGCLLKEFLTREGLRVMATTTLEVAVETIEQQAPDILLIDENEFTNLSFEGVLDQSQIPYIILSGDYSPEKAADFIENGADDFKGKPFNPRLVAEHVKAILRRPRQSLRPASVFRVGDLEVDFSRRDLRTDESTIELLNIEWKIFHLLVANFGRVVTPRQLGRAVWDLDDVVDARVHISKIRKKLREGDVVTPTIMTVWGKGYALVGDVSNGNRTT